MSDIQFNKMVLRVSDGKVNTLYVKLKSGECKEMRERERERINF